VGADEKTYVIVLITGQYYAVHVAQYRWVIRAIWRSPVQSLSR